MKKIASKKMLYVFFLRNQKINISYNDSLFNFVEKLIYFLCNISYFQNIYYAKENVSKLVRVLKKANLMYDETKFYIFFLFYIGRSIIQQTSKKSK